CGLFGKPCPPCLPRAGHHSENQRNRNRGGSCHENSVPPCELLQLITRRWRSGNDGFLGKKPPDVRGQFRGGCVSPVLLFRQGFRCNGLDIPLVISNERSQ